MTHLPSWAVPGRKVVCVRGGDFPGWVFPVKDEVYTISWVGAYTWRTGVTKTGVHVVELSRETDEYGVVHPYGLDRFRPVVTIEEDMLTFRSLLNTVPTTLTPETIHAE